MANQHPEWVIKASLEVDKLLQDIEAEKIQASQQKEDRIKSLLSAVELSRKLKADVLAAKKSLKDDELKALKEKEERAKRLKAEIEKRRNAKAIQAEIDKVKKAMTPEELKIMEAARLEIKKKRKKEEEEKKKTEAATTVVKNKPQGLKLDEINVVPIEKEKAGRKLNIEEENFKSWNDKNKQKIIEKLSQLKAAIKAKRFEAEELRKRLEAAPKLSEKEAKKVKEEKIVEETTRFQKTTKRPEEVVDPETAKPIEEVEKKLFEEVVATINKLTEITNAKQAEMKKITDAFKDPEAAQSKAVEQAIENYYNHAKVNNKLGDLAKLTEERFIGVYERLKPKSKKYTKEEQEKIDKITAEIKALQEKKKELEELLGKYTEFTREITVLELEKKPKQTQIKTSINAEEQAEIIEDAEAMEKGTGVLEQIVNVLKDMLRIGNNIEKMVPVAASTNKVINEDIETKKLKYAMMDAFPEVSKEDLSRIVKISQDDDKGLVTMVRDDGVELVMPYAGDPSDIEIADMLKFLRYESTPSFSALKKAKYHSYIDEEGDRIYKLPYDFKNLDELMDLAKKNPELLKFLKTMRAKDGVVGKDGIAWAGVDITDYLSHIEEEEIEASIKAKKIMYRKEDGEEVLVREDKEGRFQVYDRREGVWRSANEEDFVEDESLVEQEDFLKDDEVEKKLKKLKKLKRN